jgi:hypothetical protein
MSDNNLYDGQKFKILGKGERGDARIKLTGGKFCFVSEVPSDINIGAFIYITNHREGKGNADFASYCKPPAEPQGIQSTDASSATRGSATPEPKEVFFYYIGPTSKADSQAIAICTPEVLDMNAYDALTYLLQRHDDKTIFAGFTDRRIAGDMFGVYKRAKDQNALEELSVTINSEPMPPQAKKTLREYLVKDAHGKYKATTVIHADNDDSEPPAACEERKERREIYSASSTLVRVTRPGANTLEQILRKR